CLVAVVCGRGLVASAEDAPKPAAKSERPWVLYLLPHSHIDIGYTHVQTDVERRQWQNIEDALELCRKTADYPPEARFKWNMEVLWPAESYLNQASPEKRAAFIEAVKRGQIGLDGLFGNELTGLCRPEELMHLTDYARRLEREHGVVIDSAMISDVPGYTWGLVPAMAQNGIKYFSIGPNHGHRIGFTLADWGDRAFYWVSPSGDERVLCWVAGKAYSWFHDGRIGTLAKAGPEPILKYLDELAAANYPYDMVQLRYSIGGDNGPPDPTMSDYVKNWNASHASIKMVIATTGEMFREFERRYGDKVPEVRGDFTPYWEDGAASSARETALTRVASDRLVQAATLWTMLRPEAYPAEPFYQAWRNVLLYNEHTWGAHCSISQPDDPFTKSQWAIKQKFALDADAQSRALVDAAVSERRAAAAPARAIDVFNTESWPRTDLVLLPVDLAVAGDVVTTADGKPVVAQRLASGELAVLAENVPPLGAKRFLLRAGDVKPSGHAKADGATLDNGRLRLAVDTTTGAIASLRVAGRDEELVDHGAGLGLNEYVYVPSRNAKDAVRVKAVAIRVEDPGPLVATLVVEGDAPGCRKLTRRLRVVDGLDRVDIANVLDKKDVRDKEAVHLGFAFNVPEGTMRVETPWAVVRPEADQLPGSCKNYLSVGRWVDVSNEGSGVTWATVDAPLVEVGAITVDVPSHLGTAGWIRRLEPTRTFYSYLMNNYWETNYKASQDGPTQFRYAICPHGKFDSAAAARFGIERSRPMVVVPVDEKTPEVASLARVEPPEVIVTSLAPSADGRAWMLRLFNPTGEPRQATVRWSSPPKRVSLSSPLEPSGKEVAGPVELPGRGIVTLRCER
ncbi:MAG: glycosyl hydrolase family 38, partial [Planctomycetia bacterium]|nr:glycosyl hydrolase family 38 [Planctomycetia bacterium]